jgi:hypothetical protein
MLTGAPRTRPPGTSTNNIDSTNDFDWTGSLDASSLCAVKKVHPVRYRLSDLTAHVHLDANSHSEVETGGITRRLPPSSLQTTEDNNLEVPKSLVAAFTGAR